MRFPILTLVVFLLVQPSAAQQWIEHVDEERGIAITLPNEFKNAVGALAYIDPATDRGVIVWKSDTSATFEVVARDEVKAASDTMDLLGQSVTPSWATYSAIRDDGRRVDTRMIQRAMGGGLLGFR